MGAFIRLVEYGSSEEKESNFFHLDNYSFFNQKAFVLIPGSPIAYWVSEKISKIFEENRTLEKIVFADGQNKTANNDLYLRLFWEVDVNKIGKGLSYILYAKGGSFRKWYGNNEYIVNWTENARMFYRKDKIARIIKEEYWYRKGYTFSRMSEITNVRILDIRGTFDATTISFFIEETEDSIYFYLLAFFNSVVADYFLKILNPTLVIQLIDIRNIPLIVRDVNIVNDIVANCISVSNEDWDRHETTIDFRTNDLMRHQDAKLLAIAIERFSNYWREKFFEQHKNEEKLNRIFIDIYDLQDELASEVPLENISILKEESEIVNNDLSFKKSAIIQQFVSYSVGCMLGRYSIDKPGLILANQGEKLKDFLEKVPNPQFTPDEDNIIPILDDEYFPDDIVGRFKKFLKITFGEEQFAENMDFIAESIGGSGNKSSEEVIRNYFLKFFYKEHCQMYKGRPIYWLFSSGKERAFNALIYMHRYDKELLARMRTDYLHELQGKIESRLNAQENPDAKEQKKADKLKSKLRKQLDEIVAYDETLKHMSEKYIEIDLDDGVKVNYAKFEGLVEGI